jgi:6-pyruvoyltetrahydropterin/6-carboxytetrahydropterin synthase
LDDVGFVIDYRALDSMKKIIDDTFDHQHLNDVVMYNPTAEHMARDFYEMFHEMVPEVCAVEVSETPKTSARYEPS